MISYPFLFISIVKDLPRYNWPQLFTKTKKRQEEQQQQKKKTKKETYNQLLLRKYIIVTREHLSQASKEGNDKMVSLR